MYLYLILHGNPSSYSFILSLENRLGFFYLLDKICWAWWELFVDDPLLFESYFFINEVWASLLIFNVPQHIPRSKERTTILWKPQKIAFSLRSYWRFIFRLLYSFHLFSKKFCDEYSVITSFASFYNLLLYILYILIFSITLLFY